MNSHGTDLLIDWGLICIESIREDRHKCISGVIGARDESIFGGLLLMEENNNKYFG